MMWNKVLMTTIAGGLALAAGSQAQAASTFLFDASTPYLGLTGSPIAAQSGFFIEDFEDGLLNTPGLTITKGKIKNAGAKTDSVDSDDGSVDGSGTGGNSYTSGSSKSITLKFGANADGDRPTSAGLVFTDAKKADTVFKLKAWDAVGAFIGKFKVKLGDLLKTGETGEDRFLGISSDEGISKIKLSASHSKFEIDHVQFAYGEGGFAVMPVPTPLALGAVGLLGAGLMKRRLTKVAT